jgi:hypothetical protein
MPVIVPIVAYGVNDYGSSTGKKVLIPRLKRTAYLKFFLEELGGLSRPQLNLHI